MTEVGKGPRADLRDSVLSVFQIALCLLGSLDSVGKVGARSADALLHDGLEFQELTLLGVELAGALRRVVSVRSVRFEVTTLCSLKFTGERGREGTHS